MFPIDFQFHRTTQSPILTDFEFSNAGFSAAIDKSLSCIAIKFPPKALLRAE